MSKIAQIQSELRALLAAPENAPTFKAFLRAFRRRRQVPWLFEGEALTPDASDALAEGLETALQAYRAGPIPPPLRNRVPEDVTAPFLAALDHLTSDLAANHFLATAICSDDNLTIGTHLLAALRQYEAEERERQKRCLEPA